MPRIHQRLLRRTRATKQRKPQSQAKSNAHRTIVGVGLAEAVEVSHVVGGLSLVSIRRLRAQHNCEPLRRVRASFRGAISTSDLRLLALASASICGAAGSALQGRKGATARCEESEHRGLMRDLRAQNQNNKKVPPL
jgi:hypothetical protein